MGQEAHEREVTMQLRFTEPASNWACLIEPATNGLWVLMRESDRRVMHEHESLDQLVRWASLSVRRAQVTWKRQTVGEYLYEGMINYVVERTGQIVAIACAGVSVHDNVLLRVALKRR